MIILCIHSFGRAFFIEETGHPKLILPLGMATSFEKVFRHFQWQHPLKSCTAPSAAHQLRSTPTSLHVHHVQAYFANVVG